MYKKRYEFCHQMFLFESSIKSYFSLNFVIIVTEIYFLERKYCVSDKISAAEDTTQSIFVCSFAFVNYMYYCFFFRYLWCHL